MKKIFFVIGSLSGGGAERVAMLIANHLYDTGYDVSIISFDLNNQQYDNNCPVFIINKDNKLGQIIKIRSILKDNRPDSVIAFEYHIGMKAILATLGMKIKIIVSERNDPNQVKNIIKRGLRNFLFSFADALVCQTNDALGCFPKCIQRKAIVIPNPIKNDLPLWKKEECKNIIINFCRLEKQKNLPLLIAVFAIIYKKHPEFKLMIFGEGGERERIKQLITNYRLEKQIRIMSFTEDIHEIVSECMVFVSTSDFEGISNSMLESMAMGMPVICTDCPIGGAKEFIKDRDNGRLVPVNNVTMIAEALEEIITNSQFRLSLGRNAYLIREELSIETVVQRWHQLF